MNVRISIHPWSLDYGTQIGYRSQFWSHNEMDTGGPLYIHLSYRISTCIQLLFWSHVLFHDMKDSQIMILRNQGSWRRTDDKKQDHVCKFITPSK